MSTEPISPKDASSAPPNSAPGPDPWADPAYLRHVQYVTPANLAARQAIYDYHQPRIRIYDWALDLGELEGGEAILDVGCGNGGYLAALHRRGHEGLTVGIDFSSGMLSTARRAGGPACRQPVVQGDASALGFADSCADVALVMHMLYHVPDRMRALAELRRVVRPGGLVLIALNGAHHQGELQGLVREALSDSGESPAIISASETFDLDAGEELAARFFVVERHELRGELVVPEPGPVLAYVKSMSIVQSGHGNENDILRVIDDKVRDRIGVDGAFRISTVSGCLVCR